MTDPRAIDVLNELRLIELTSLVPRLAESTVFVAPETASDHAEVQRMIGEETEHVRLLEEMILELGGSLRPRRGDITSADLHYVALRVLLPRVVENQRRLAAAYETAAPRLASSPDAAALVSQIAARHRDHAERLERLLDRFQSPATQSVPRP